MALVPISLGHRSNPSRHAKQAGNARLINCFAEEIGEEGKTPWVITACPGYANFGSSIGSDGVRNMLEVDGSLYVVAGRQALTTNTLGVSTVIPGAGVPTEGPVFMRRNRAIPVQTGIVSDGFLGVIQSNYLTEIIDSDLPAPSALAYLDGYGILPGANGRYMITAVDDFTSIDGLDEGTAEANPDPIVISHELGREVYHFGTQSTEAHQNTGDADFPLTRSQAMDVGCAAAGSVHPVDTAAEKALVFIAHDHRVRILAGYQHSVISTGEIEDLIRRLAESGALDTLEATAWSWGGRSFYSLSCPQWTRCYDSRTGYWHERKSYGLDYWKIGKVVPFAGKLIAGDYTTGQLYQIKDEYYDEAGQPLVMEIITPPVHAFPYGGIVNALYPDIVSGVGLNTTAPQNLDPVALIDWSKDGGETFCSPREVKLHRLGQTGRRIQPLLRLGRFGQKGIVFRIRISAAVKKVMLSLQADIEQLAA